MIHKIKTIKKILEEANVTWWMDCGSLIHLYRDGYIEKDDVDFGVLIEDFDKLLSTLEKNRHLFEMIHVRNKEISIRYLGVKFDFLMYEPHGNDIYLYAYKQNPFCSNKWNWEWRAKFPIDVFLPVKQMTLLGEEFNVPNDIDKRLTLQYGNWRIPVNVPAWTSDMNLALDKQYNPIAIVMTTFLRDEALFKVLPSYLQYPVKLYLLDQGLKTPEKDKLYNELREKGHYIEYSEFDIGLAAARNKLIEHVEEEYVLLTEDDIELKSNPYSLLNYFTNNNLGVLGGLLIRQPENTEQHYEYELEIQNNELIYKKSDKINIVLNFALIKRKLFNDVKYDNRLKLVEHTDFYLNLKQINKWSVNYTRNLLGWHYHEKPESYMIYRERGNDYIKIFKKKWNINKITKDSKLIDTEKLDISNDLTVFLITSGEEINYKDVLTSLKNQNISFKLDIIKDIHPMSAAFQEMINRCRTPYYIQVDGDMVLESNAIESLFNAIKRSSASTAMVCFKLHDNHLNKDIEGIKVYKHNIFKNFSYQDTIGCDMNQLKDLASAGYTIEKQSKVLGLHSPKWTKTSIFHRYYSFALKHLQKSPDSLPQMMNSLLQIFVNNPNKLNFYSLLGSLGAILSPNKNYTEKDFSELPTSEFKLLDKIFSENAILKDNLYSVNELPLILHVSSIPCANRPYNTAKLIEMYSTKYSSRHILGTQYGKNRPDVPWREFPEDLNWINNRTECIELINKAAIIHIHHNIAKDMRSYIPEKTPIIWTVSNLSQSMTLNNNEYNRNYMNYIKSFANLITTTEEPLQKEAFFYLTNICLPLVTSFYNAPLIKDNSIPTIVYAPTNRVNYRDNKPISKGYQDVLQIINNLNKYCTFNFHLVEGIPYEENINIKKTADIIIDDVISETYHNSTIEALYFNAIPLTNFSSPNMPLIKTNLDNLEQNLYELIIHREYLEEQKKKIEEWKKLYYYPEKILKKFEFLYDYLLTKNIPKKPEQIHIKKLTPLEMLIIINNLCKEHKIELILLEHTCKEYVTKANITSFNLVLTSTNNKLLIEMLLQKGFLLQENLMTCGDINIDLKPNHIKQTKTGKRIDLQEFKVPFPVINYLTKLYGDKWNE